MRWLAGIVAVVCSGAVGLGIAHTYSTRLQAARNLEDTTAAVQRLQREIAVRSATKSAPLNERGYPNTVDPAWFKDGHPGNALLSDDHPWLEIASIEEAELQHPEVRVAVSETTPTMWYNPYQGIVRARVPVAVSDDQSLAEYNRVNNTALPSLFWKEPTPAKVVEVATTDSSAAFSTDESTPPKSKKSNALTRRKKSQPVVVVHREPKATETAHAGE